ncbi:uridine 5'-monophosphate synthase isoform X1 [Cotesia glomerata]|uniref:uridine 5'-monophosphate synthase isoform X1 n=1 Tax=Cotesia glomerata TaxID=32391 RepID=UPI001D02565B|nr:uridine 5'-monophosphate synthase isoform X1 [Cotesia glomerata]
MESELKNLAVMLFDVGAIKFGEFITKVGLKTPVYIDLRVIISYPKLLNQISNILWKLADDVDKIDQICGVPYTALPIATLISVDSNIPMLIRRKEAKSYGTKKLIEGKFATRDNTVIIEDVVTSGSSILETVKDLKQEGLNVTAALVVMDREQGGRKNIEDSGIKMKSLYTMTKLMEYLQEAGKVTQDTVDSVLKYLAECLAPVNTLEKGKSNDRLKMDFLSRSKLAKNQIAAKLLQLMDMKETTLCLAADLTKADEIVDLAKLAGPHIAVLKIHVDIIEDFNQDFINQLKNLSEKHKFLIMEDRKFGDIGNTVSLQYSKGVYKIAEWADLITVHPVAGPGILDGLKNALKNITDERGIFLITEMSSKGALTTGDYAKQSLAMAETSDLVVGHVCQSNIFSNPGLVQLTPGVKISKASDDMGQQYNTPEAVVNSGADLAVVGRGITEAGDKLREVINYKNQLWTAYKNRIN